MRILLTGSSGKLGRATGDRLQDLGHEVLGVDLHGTAGAGFTRVDLQDYGQVLDTMLGVTARHSGLDAVVHLAAIPVNGIVPDVTTFHNNVTATFNVAFAAHRAGIRTLVVASSITAMGFPFEVAPPALPVDEDYTAAFTTYGLGKVVEEAMFGQLVGWDPELSITALRYTNVVGEGEWGTFARAGDPDYRRDLLGSYVDVRDGAEAVVAALTHARPGFEAYVIAAPDSGVDIPSPELAARWFPGVPVASGLGDRDPLVSSAKAARELGWTATRLWRDHYSV
ncbi:NAD-dependent epimerase/dehydratase family protein [Protaetiibacter mangrovi]|uniref:NAD(P)-dependent oxidoreductase n=1 Tax=Protaetiibacter mangrovi TaxID=2970926 RepID=A0ABT1ZHG4_9MICO|nr:NAD(P)-dependent oxidoreductase [Protaetiibacter mangrovi]MCS0500146.1 NAD(P)-dependent oxidoreductase [Protaetiibacter mangrovi]TPX03293.1 NAD(P)-dependent oxidoreductase [Schumannella luteola]